MSSASEPAESRRARRPFLPLGIAAGIAGFVAWQVFLHRVVSDNPRSVAAELLIAAPLLIFAAWMTARSRAGVPGGVLVLATGVAGCVAWNRSGNDALLPLLPHLAIYLLLLAWFGASLLPGREPLVTCMARQIHGTMPEALVAYTRRVTIAWCVFFFAMALTAVILFAWAPVDVWSAFVNLFNLPLVVAMFAAEYLWRTLRHPGLSQVSIPTMVRSFWKLGSDDGPSARD